MKSWHLGVKGQNCFNQVFMHFKIMSPMATPRSVAITEHFAFSMKKMGRRCPESAS